MKYVFIIYSIILSACSSLSNYQQQPVIELNDNTYKATCNGIAESWDSCFRKAQKTCNSGYAVVEKTQLNDFVHREIVFKCNK